MRLEMFWEQMGFELELSSTGFTPIDLCEQLGEDGRAALMDVLMINYGEELKGFIKSIERTRSCGYEGETAKVSDQVIISGEKSKAPLSKTQGDWWYSQEDFVTDEGLPAWELANRKLKAEREKAPVVYGNVPGVIPGCWWGYKLKAKYRARLDGIEELKDE